MTIEERIENLEKGYKQLCHSHDNNKHIHLLTSNTIKHVNENFKEIKNLIKEQQKINLGIIQKLQELENKQ